MTAAPSIYFSSPQDPRSWDPYAEDVGVVITCISNGDAKKAEKLFNDLLARCQHLEHEVESLQRRYGKVKKFASIAIEQMRNYPDGSYMRCPFCGCKDSTHKSDCAIEIVAAAISNAAPQVQTSQEQVHGDGKVLSATVDFPSSEALRPNPAEPAVAAPKWIPMKERQPTDFERVLCVNSAGYMTTANRFHDTKLDCWNGSDYTAEEQQELVIGGITHWMRLPEPPHG